MSKDILYARPVFNLLEMENKLYGEWSKDCYCDIEIEILNQFMLTGFYRLQDSTNNGTYISKYNVISFTVEEMVKKT
jgi:hypothetical protein